MRSEFLLKLALIRRRGDDPARLLTGQRDVLVTVTAALDRVADDATGYDRVLLDWRRATANAALGFVDDLAATAAHRPDPVSARQRARAPS